MPRSPAAKAKPALTLYPPLPAGKITFEEMRFQMVQMEVRAAREATEYAAMLSPDADHAAWAAHQRQWWERISKIYGWLADIAEVIDTDKDDYGNTPLKDRVTGKLTELRAERRRVDAEQHQRQQQELAEANDGEG